MKKAVSKEIKTSGRFIVHLYYRSVGRQMQLISGFFNSEPELQNEELYDDFRYLGLRTSLFYRGPYSLAMALVTCSDVILVLHDRQDYPYLTLGTLEFFPVFHL